MMQAGDKTPAFMQTILKKYVRNEIAGYILVTNG